MYSVLRDGYIRRLSDLALIPPSEQNEDYKEYLRWVGDGNVAERENAITTAEGPTEIEKARMAQISAIKERLAALDSKSIRALREGNSVRLSAIEDEAVVLRAQMAALQ